MQVSLLKIVQWNSCVCHPSCEAQVTVFLFSAVCFTVGHSKFHGVIAMPWFLQKISLLEHQLENNSELFQCYMNAFLLKMVLLWRHVSNYFCCTKISSMTKCLMKRFKRKMNVNLCLWEIMCTRHGMRILKRYYKDCSSYCSLFDKPLGTWNSKIWEMRRIFTIINGAWCIVTSFNGDFSIKMKFCQILVQLIANIFNLILPLLGRPETSFRTFYDFVKMPNLFDVLINF